MSATTARALSPASAFLIKCGEFKIMAFDLQHGIITNPSCLRIHLITTVTILSSFFFFFLALQRQPSFVTADYEAFLIPVFG